MDRRNFNPEVGDDVKIRSWDDMVAEFGLDEDGNIPCRFEFVGYMKDMCGEEFTITDIIDGRYIGYPDNNVAISIDMIEPVIENESVDTPELDDFLSGIKIATKEETS